MCVCVGGVMNIKFSNMKGFMLFTCIEFFSHEWW